MAAEVLREAIDAGFGGVMIGTLPKGLGGVLDDPGLDAFWQAASQLQAAVFLHPMFLCGEPRLADYDLVNAIGRVADTSIAVARLLFSGHLPAPGMKLVLSHGGPLPLVLGRLARNFLPGQVRRSRKGFDALCSTAWCSTDAPFSRARLAQRKSCSARTCRFRSATWSRARSCMRRALARRSASPSSAAMRAACFASGPTAGAGAEVASVALEMKGEYVLPVEQAELWRLLNDPDVLAKIIPGCNSVRALGSDRYEMGLKLQVGSVSGEYMGSVAILDKQEPLHYILTVEGQGSIGFMKGRS
jgi:hypothetical protein